MSKNDVSDPKGDKHGGRAITIGYLLLDGFSLMSYAPVVEPFRAANLLAGSPLYAWTHLSAGGRPAGASNGVTLSVDGALEYAGALDILFVCAGGNPALVRDESILQSLRRIARRGTVMAGVSGGPFILARAGLLDGHRCTIHWEHEDAFVETFPDIQLERGLYVIDRSRLTCAGGMAGLDLAIALIATAQGPDLAARVSDWYIRTQEREGRRAQRNSVAQRFRVYQPALISALSEMEGNVAEPLSRETLASRAGVSVRQLERLFSTHLRSTIGAHYLHVRLDTAMRLLRETSLSRIEIAVACGFVSPSHFSRVFRTRFETSPTAVRNPRSDSSTPG